MKMDRYAFDKKEITRIKLILLEDYKLNLRYFYLIRGRKSVIFSYAGFLVSLFYALFPYGEVTASL